MLFMLSRTRTHISKFNIFTLNRLNDGCCTGRRPCSDSALHVFISCHTRSMTHTNPHPNSTFAFVINHHPMYIVNAYGTRARRFDCFRFYRFFYPCVALCYLLDFTRHLALVVTIIE
ncbi:hypothetical protein BDR04DRAFT_368621 [Suillus decipiens]|nr:hypothetical protein BDR04DRAFT_368621 [Suillus decipiens]